MSNQEFYIAVGNSCESKSWRNQLLTFEQLVSRCRRVKTTGETFKEYQRASKAEKNKAKDVGGFVGGANAVGGGPRKKSNFKSRSLITLDIDEGQAGTDYFARAWDLCRCQVLAYTTHSHTPERPRLRLILPLAHDIDLETFGAVSRYIADKIGGEDVDPCCFRPTQIMFWPSKSTDGEFYCISTLDEETDHFHPEAEPLNAEEFLDDNFPGWHDHNLWPLSSREGDSINADIAADIRKQGDPLEKPGIVGAFCRTYSVVEAIESFLPEIYEATDRPDRYTFTGGTTSAGLVIYDDDRFAFSNHKGHDPAACGHCLNAFDLVRLHKFGDMDENAKDGTPAHKRPSYIAMEEFARNDRETRTTINREKIETARAAFADGADDDPLLDLPASGSTRARALPSPESDWFDDLAARLDMDKKNNFLPTQANFEMILSGVPELKNIYCDTFAQRIIVRDRLPWSGEGDTFPREWDKFDDAELQSYFALAPWKLDNPGRLQNAFNAVIARRQFHPVRDYLNGLEWDGRERIETLLIDYLGAEDSPLVRAITRKWVVAAVARVMAPGCKFDYLLTMIGPEGIGKSRFLAALAGDNWFSDSLTSIEGKEAGEIMAGKWLIEFGELTNYKKSTVEAYKAFISRTTDRYREAFGRRAQDYPRQCVFAATTNEDTPLKGDTGNRRFWVVNVGANEPMAATSSDLQAVAAIAPGKRIGSLCARVVAQVREQRAQIWAEAVEAWRKGEDLYLPEELEIEARQAQERANEAGEDPRRGMIEAYLLQLLPNDWDGRTPEERRAFFCIKDPGDRVGSKRREKVCAVEILSELFGEKIDEKTKYKTRPINQILTSLDIIDASKAASRVSFGAYGQQHPYYIKWPEDPEEFGDVFD